MLINIFGPSGSGKTTLIKELIRSKQLFKFYFYLIEPSTKKSLFKTLSTSLMPLPNFRGSVFDYFNLFGLPFDSPLENKYLEQLKKSTYNFNFSNHDNMASRLFQTLSAGEQRRLVLFRALISNSDLVVIDEPFCNSDEKLKENILQSIYHWGLDINQYACYHLSFPELYHSLL